MSWPNFSYKFFVGSPEKSTAIPVYFVKEHLLRYIFLNSQDGTLNSTAHVEVKVVDVQNSPPVFSGALTGALAEDAPVGTLALTIKARDADRAQPREVRLELVTSK